MKLSVAPSRHYCRGWWCSCAEDEIEMGADWVGIVVEGQLGCLQIELVGRIVEVVRSFNWSDGRLAL